MPSALILRASDPTSLLFWCALGMVAGICLFGYGFRLLQRRRLILDTPFSKIRSASMGMVEISGLAVGPYTMPAPITARPCYYYRTLIWEYKQSGKNKQWVKVAGECMHLPFFVDDNTGRVLVDPRGAELDIHCDFKEEFCDSFFTTKDPAPDNVHSFLSRHGIVTSNKIKVEEYCIKPKNSLFILGTLAENKSLAVAPQPLHDENASHQSVVPLLSFSFNKLFSFSMGRSDSGDDFDATAFAQRFSSPPINSHAQVVHLSPDKGPAKSADMTQQQKVSAALLRAGISNPAAWSAAGVANDGIQVMEAPPPVAGQFVPGGNAANGSRTPSLVAKAQDFDPHPPVVLTKGVNNKAFLISWRSQQDVARSLGWKCTLMIWGGPALALVSLYVLLSIEHLL